MVGCQLGASPKPIGGFPKLLFKFANVNHTVQRPIKKTSSEATKKAKRNKIIKEKSHSRKAEMALKMASPTGIEPILPG